MPTEEERDRCQAKMRNLMGNENTGLKSTRETSSSGKEQRSATLAKNGL